MDPAQPRTVPSTSSVHVPSNGWGSTRTQSAWVTLGGTSQVAASTWKRPTVSLIGRLAHPLLARARRPTRPFVKVESAMSTAHADGSADAERHALARIREPSRRTRTVQSVPAGTPVARVWGVANWVTVSATSFSTRSSTAPVVRKDSRAR